VDFAVQQNPVPQNTFPHGADFDSHPLRGQIIDRHQDFDSVQFEFFEAEIG
jgi:hypothetical protein